jgi:hypothetical protein
VDVKLQRVLLVVAFGSLLSAPLHADAVVGGIGPRVGISLDPEQVVFGGQLIIGEIAPDLTFDPSLEFGFGDDLTIIALNFDVHYHFVVTGAGWRPYAGGGVGLNFIEFDNIPGRDNSVTEVGLNLVGGAGVPTSSGNRFFAEAKFGLGDIPTLKMLVGWNFKI